MYFECVFLDNTVFRQHPEDQSAIDPTKNSFYDIEHRLSEVAFFGLFGGNKTLIVDLRDGHFEVNGVPVRIDGINASGLKLVYFRRNRIFVIDDAIHSQTEFHVGWEGVVDGRFERRTLSVTE